MTTTRVDNYGEWRALVASWALGIAHPDDNLRSTAKREELEEVLRVSREASARFADENMSVLTLRYADMVASNAGVAPQQYPAVVIWSFETIPFVDVDSEQPYLFWGGFVTVVTQKDLTDNKISA